MAEKEARDFVEETVSRHREVLRKAGEKPREADEQARRSMEKSIAMQRGSK